MSSSELSEELRGYALGVARQEVARRALPLAEALVGAYLVVFLLSLVVLADALHTYDWKRVVPAGIIVVLAVYQAWCWLRYRLRLRRYVRGEATDSAS